VKHLQTDLKMARSERQERPVSDEEFESMPDRISQHFDRVREHLDSETNGEN